MSIAHPFSSKCVGLVFIALLAGLYCPAAESVALYNGASASGTFPVNPAFTSIGNIRMGISPSLGLRRRRDYYGWIFYFGQFYARFLPGPAILNMSDNYEWRRWGESRFDRVARILIIRFQRDKANSRMTLEAWNTDGTGYVYATNTLSSDKNRKHCRHADDVWRACHVNRPCLSANVLVGIALELSSSLADGRGPRGLGV